MLIPVKSYKLHLCLLCFSFQNFLTVNFNKNSKAEMFENLKNKGLSGTRLTFLKLLNTGPTIRNKCMQQKSPTLILCRDPSF